MKSQFLLFGLLAAASIIEAEEASYGIRGITIDVGQVLRDYG